MWAPDSSHRDGGSLSAIGPTANVSPNRCVKAGQSQHRACRQRYPSQTGTCVGGFCILWCVFAQYSVYGVMLMACQCHRIPHIMAPMHWIRFSVQRMGINTACFLLQFVQLAEVAAMVATAQLARCAQPLPLSRHRCILKHMCWQARYMVASKNICTRYNKTLRPIKHVLMLRHRHIRRSGDTCRLTDSEPVDRDKASQSLPGPLPKSCQRGLARVPLPRYLGVKSLLPRS